MKRLAITGAGGRIASAVRNGLSGVEITPIDLPEYDVRELSTLNSILPGHDVVLHLAHQPESFRSDTLNTDNTRMIANVYAAAVASNVPRVIMASSIHATQCVPLTAGLLDTAGTPVPDSPYGANKVFAEALGRHYTTRGLEVIAIRFGGVNAQDERPTDDPSEQRVWLSHRDCAALVQKCVDAETIPDGYCCINAVSNFPSRYHDTSNPFGWTSVETV